MEIIKDQWGVVAGHSRHAYSRKLVEMQIRLILAVLIEIGGTIRIRDFPSIILQQGGYTACLAARLPCFAKIAPGLDRLATRLRILSVSGWALKNHYLLGAGPITPEILHVRRTSICFRSRFVRRYRVLFHVSFSVN